MTPPVILLGVLGLAIGAQALKRGKAPPPGDEPLPAADPNLPPSVQDQVGNGAGGAAGVVGGVDPTGSPSQIVGGELAPSPYPANDSTNNHIGTQSGHTQTGGLGGLGGTAPHPTHPRPSTAASAGNAAAGASVSGARGLAPNPALKTASGVDSRRAFHGAATGLGIAY